METSSIEQYWKNMMDGTLDLVIGGGRAYYESEANISLLAKAKKSGLNYYTKWKPTEVYELPMAGIYADTSMDTTNESLPSLEKMTNLALELLSEDVRVMFFQKSCGMQENLRRCRKLFLMQIM